MNEEYNSLQCSINKIEVESVECRNENYKFKLIINKNLYHIFECSYSVLQQFHKSLSTDNYVPQFPTKQTTNELLLKYLKELISNKNILKNKLFLDFAKLNESFFDMNEVSKHNSIDNKTIWIVVNGIIYDITSFVERNRHFSTTVIKPYYGKDATFVFKGVVHSNYAKKLLKTYEIGKLLRTCTHKKPVEIRKKTCVDECHNVFVSKIFIYPIKGCGYISVNKASVSYDGLINDRIYAFCNKKTLKVINQLRYPVLSQIVISFIDDNAQHFDEGIKINGIIVPVHYSKQNELLVTWKSSETPIKAFDQGRKISKWITNYINDKRDYILVRISKNNHREIKNYYKISNENNNMNGFQNYAPVSLTSQESLNELNKRLNKNRQLTWATAGFRMNIIIAGLPAPHYEDFMKNIVFKSNKHVEMLWSRRRYVCAVPQVNQITSEITREPMNTLSKYRNALDLNDSTAPPGKDSVFFGSLYCVRQCGVISVGQKVVTKWKQFDSNRSPIQYEQLNKLMYCSIFMFCVFIHFTIQSLY